VTYPLLAQESKSGTSVLLLDLKSELNREKIFFNTITIFI
jgi:hypothetical protein